MSKTILLAACVALLLPCCSSAEPLARATRIADGVEIASGASRIDVQILDDQVACLHVQLNENETPRTLVMDPHPDLRQPTSVSGFEREGMYTLSTPGMIVRIQEKAPFTITFLDPAWRQLLESIDPFHEARNTGVTMLHATADTPYGIHGLDREDISDGLTRDNGGNVAAGVQGNSGASFIFSAGYGVLVDSDGGVFSAVPGSFTFAHDSRPDAEYVVLAGPPLATIASLSRLVGPPPMPPKWTLGFINSQWGFTQDEVEQIVAEYRQKQIPLDGFILDFDWKAWGEDNYGEWRWNSTNGPGNVAPGKFPDGASGVFAARLTRAGVNLGGILKPRILTTVAGNPDQPIEAAAYATAHHFWSPSEVLIPDYYSHRMGRDLDFNNPAERSWCWQHLVPAFHAGMAAWWNDEADVSGKTIFNNFQFLNMGRMLYQGQRGDSDLRVRSIILATQPTEQYVDQRRITAFTLDIFPSPEEADFLAYDDNGRTYRYEKGDYIRQEIKAELRGGETTLTIAPATGNYASSLRWYLLRVHVAAKEVRLNGNLLLRTSVPKLPESSAGSWALTKDRFGQVVLLRARAGEQSKSVITLC